MNRTLDTLKFYDYSIPEGHDHHEVSDSVILNSDEEKDQDFDLDEEIRKIKAQYQFVKSSCSTKISDIEGIVFGGTSSRFWIYRKHKCSLDFNLIKNDTLSTKKARRTSLPFYSWQCISLYLKDRSVDLVIKNEKNMDLFIRFLVMSLNTIDGNKDSAEIFIQNEF